MVFNNKPIKLRHLVNFNKLDWSIKLFDFFMNIPFQSNTKQCLPFIQLETQYNNTLNIFIFFVIIKYSYEELYYDDKCYGCLPNCPKWKDLECDEFKLLSDDNKPIILKTNSRYMNANNKTIWFQNYKTCYLPFQTVFIKDFGKNFTEYIHKLKSKIISKEQNTQLFLYLLNKVIYLRNENIKFNTPTFDVSKINLDNHNEEVDILHFKFMIRE